METYLENNKFYIPEISEFHVGFEYEALWGIENIDGEWLQETFQSNQSCASTEETTRVKYLDLEDIREQGFILDMVETKLWGNFIGYSHDKLFHITYLPHDLKGGYTPETTELTITKKRDSTTGIFYDVVFKGIIKNKTELRKILNQIGYGR